MQPTKRPVAVYEWDDGYRVAVYTAPRGLQRSGKRPSVGYFEKMPPDYELLAALSIEGKIKPMYEKQDQYVWIGEDLQQVFRDEWSKRNGYWRKVQKLTGVMIDFAPLPVDVEVLEGSEARHRYPERFI